MYVGVVCVVVFEVEDFCSGKKGRAQSVELDLLGYRSSRLSILSSPPGCHRSGAAPIDAAQEPDGAIR
jgi:hypothetical protein